MVPLLMFGGVLGLWIRASQSHPIQPFAYALVAGGIVINIGFAIPQAADPMGRQRLMRFWDSASPFHCRA